MFIKTQEGNLVNLMMVGEIYVGRAWTDRKEQSVVRAYTGGGGEEDREMVKSNLFIGTQAECLEYMDNLIHALQTKELWLPVLLPIKEQL